MATRHLHTVARPPSASESSNPQVIIPTRAPQLPAVVPGVQFANTPGMANPINTAATYPTVYNPVYNPTTATPNRPRSAGLGPSSPVSPLSSPSGFPSNIPTNHPTVASGSPSNAPTDPAAVSGVPVYNYKFYNPGDNHISTDDTTLPTYTTSTTRDVMKMHKQTVVTCTIPGEKGTTLQGDIDWKAKQIRVGNVSKPLSEARQKIGGMLSLNDEWTWSSGTYMVTHDSKAKTWTVNRGGQDVAVYTARKPFSKTKLATFQFLVNMPYEERIFVILVAMYHDFQLPAVTEARTTKERAAQAGVHVATRLATTVVVNSITACCVIQ